MGRSVPRQIDRKGEHLSRCDTCGVPYLRSALVRGNDGLLRCDNDREGRNELTLAQLTAARAAALSQRLGTQSPADGAFPDVNSSGQPSSGSSYTGPTARTTAEDIYNDAVPTYMSPGTRTNLPGF